MVCAVWRRSSVWDLRQSTDVGRLDTSLHADSPSVGTCVHWCCSNDSTYCLNNTSLSN